MNAQEMFEKLGYDYFSNGLRITYENYKISECKMIEFDSKEKEIRLADDSKEIVVLSYDEIKAINKQCKELGWDKE